MDWVSLLCVLVTLYVYIRQSSIYLSVFPAREFGDLFSLYLNLFCLEPHLLKQCLWLGTDEKTQVRDREQRNRICQPRGLFIIFWNLSEMMKSSLQSSDHNLTCHVCRPRSVLPLGFLMNFFKLFTASPLFCVPSFRGTLLAVPSVYREYTEVIVANETIKSKHAKHWNLRICELF